MFIETFVSIQSMVFGVGGVGGPHRCKIRGTLL